MEVNMFNKEKDLLLRITNAILILWLVVALCFTAGSIINNVMRNDMLTYDEYKTAYCQEEKDLCQTNYTNEKINYDNDISYNKKEVLICITMNVIIISALVVLNIPKKNRH